MINIYKKIFLIALTFILACSPPHPQDRDILKFKINIDELAITMNRMEVLLEKVSSSMENEYEVRNEHLYIQYKDVGNVNSISKLPNLSFGETKEFIGMCNMLNRNYINGAMKFGYRKNGKAIYLFRYKVLDDEIRDEVRLIYLNQNKAAIDEELKGWLKYTVEIIGSSERLYLLKYKP